VQETVPTREAHISTGGLGKRSAAQPSTRYRGTVKNNCRPNRNAAVCADTPWLAMMGMICTVAPIFAIRRNAIPPVRFQNTQERNVAWGAGGIWPVMVSVAPLRCPLPAPPAVAKKTNQTCDEQE